MKKLISFFIICAAAIAYQYWNLNDGNKQPKTIFATPGWERLSDTFREVFDSDLNDAGTFAVYHKGKLVFEALAGYADKESYIPISKDTLVQIFSSTKALGALVIAKLVDRGLLDYKSPVSKYWPEFAKNGKEGVTVEQLLSHQAGLPYTDPPLEYRAMLDQPETTAKVLAESKPLWKLGSGFGYHTLTIGLYEDQLVRRVDPKKRNLAEFFNDEFAKPFDLDIAIGLPKSETYRTARTYASGLFSKHFLGAYKYWYFAYRMIFQPDSLFSMSLSQAGWHPEFSWNDPRMREVPNPSANGFAIGRDLAKLYGALSTGGTINGKTVLKEKQIKQLLEPVISGEDLLLSVNSTYSRGVLLLPTPSGGYCFGTPGAGGQMTFADVNDQLGWAFLTNYHGHHLVDDPRYVALTDTMYEIVGNLKKNTR